ncbi:thiamine biosynthesis lipoprotein [Devosia subaequoris]|uniref:FAD:protein FMN transferase n=1 Tax=Devosia subaequoris TaxID=395930 RepID=A0A7W6IM35_9HYPH|nr:FAD:protein FMN transferase [Devosia subaequoris]MBB4052143.1 thiamine biosynthesis lipoprotein [Devosia subaequoris]MCP1209308.1 FAD:protein FMN transferase [Devosia subaequoris]
MLTRRNFMALSAATLVTGAVPALARQLVTLGGRAFGSYWRLSAPQGIDQDAISISFSHIIAEVDQLFSPYRADSILSQFNLHAGTDWQRVPDTFSLLAEKSLALAQVCGGVFDPTVGPAVARQGFGPIKGVEGSFEELAVQPGAARKHRGGLTLDLCGIAKGEALGRMAASLAHAGVNDYLLDLGGEVIAHGRHPEGRAWQVGVELPGTGDFAHILRLDGHAIATSGNSRQGYALSGKTYGHIVSPATGRAADASLASVSVLGHDPAMADGWATALAAAGVEKGVALAEQLGLAALFLMYKGDRLHSVFTGDFSAVVEI